MRLTLRTLLAYLDNVLEPEDAAELAKKIEESEVAKALVRRIRELLRKEKLGASEVLDHRESLDPNTVAEYLDNTLPSEKVADFEKVCLESDIELAEVAACHQILAIVLGEPAEVDPALRERIYRLPQVAAQSESAVERIVRDLTQETEQASEKEAEVAPPSKASRAPEEAFVANVQDHSKRSWLLGLALGLLVGLIFVSGWMIYRGFQHSSTKEGEGLALKEPDVSKEAKSDVSPQESPALPPASGTLETESQAAADAHKPVSSQQTDEQPGAASPASPEESGTGEQPHPGGAPAGPGMASATPVEQPEEATFQLPPGPESAGPREIGVAPQIPQLPKGPVGDLVPEPPGAASPPVRGLPSDTIPDAVPLVEAAPLPPEPLGTLLDDPRLPQVLFVLLPKQPLHRVLPGQQVRTGDNLFAPPSFRPKLRVGETLDFQSAGPAFWEMASVDAQGRVSLNLMYGNFIVTSVVPDGTQLRLKCGNIQGTLELADQYTVVALGVQRESVCLGDPETQAVPWNFDLYVTAGVARWLDAERARPLVLRAPVQVRLSETELQAVPLVDQPEWVRPSVGTSAIIEERAMQALERALRDGEKDAVQILVENAGVRQREIAWLAKRTLAYLGRPEELWKTLNDVEQRAYWPEAWSILRQLVRISPKLAADTRRAAEEILVSDGALAYAFLWRYPDSELTLAQAEELVQHLDHEKLAIRVLASLTLRHITQMTLNYEPHAPITDRRRVIDLWRERLKAGTVRGVLYKPTTGGQ